MLTLLTPLSNSSRILAICTTGSVPTGHSAVTFCSGICCSPAGGSPHDRQSGLLLRRQQLVAAAHSAMAAGVFAAGYAPPWGLAHDGGAVLRSQRGTTAQFRRSCSLCGVSHGTEGIAIAFTAYDLEPSARAAAAQSAAAAYARTGAAAPPGA